MYRFLLTILILFSCQYITCFANGKGKTTIRGVECAYDTVTYRTIAPGATLTQLQFNNIQMDDTQYKMKAHIITIDLTNPYSSFSPYLAKDQYFTMSRQDQEVARRKANGMKPVASITGGAFYMSNSPSVAAEKNEMKGSIVTKKEIKYESYGSTLNCYTDADKTVHVGYTEMKGTLSANGKSYTIGQVNHSRDVTDKKELITLFCNGMNKSRALDTSTGTDVKVKLLNNTKVLSSTDIECEVISVYDNCGNTFKEGEAILSGVGKAAEFLRSLKAGDKVTVNISYIDSNKQPVVITDQMTNLLGYYITEGKVKYTDQRNTAICCIGTSKDGKTAYWADLEMSADSNAPAVCLLDLLVNIGVYNAMSLDGGPSAEMTVDGSFITVNSIKDFGGRYIPAGYILYSDAPEDNTLEHIEMAKALPATLYKGESMTVELYGYNKYDEMILSDAQTNSSVEISCSNDIGTISNGVFTAKNYGDGIITAKLSGSSDVIRIPVSVIERHILTAYPKTIFTGEGRECQVKLTYTDDSGTIDLDPSLATWTKAGKFVIASCNNGVIVPWADGKDNVYVSYNGAKDSITVTVENLEEFVPTLDLTKQVYHPTYFQFTLPSVPESFTAIFKGEADKEFSLLYTLGNGTMLTATATIGSDGTYTMTVPLDYDNIYTYPVTLVRLSASSEGVEMTNLSANYKAGTTNIASSIKEVTTPSSQTYNLAGQRVNANHAKGILIRNGKKYIAR